MFVGVTQIYRSFFSNQIDIKFKHNLENVNLCDRGIAPSDFTVMLTNTNLRIYH